MYHVVNHYLSEETIQNGEEYSSWLEGGYLVKITKPGPHMVSENDFIKRALRQGSFVSKTL